MRIGPAGAWAGLLVTRRRGRGGVAPLPPGRGGPARSVSAALVPAAPGRRRWCAAPRQPRRGLSAVGRCPRPTLSPKSFREAKSRIAGHPCRRWGPSVCSSPSGAEGSAPVKSRCPLRRHASTRAVRFPAVKAARCNG